MKRNVIALTGGIGSGKSTVGNYLRQKGFDVIDCDQVSREVATHPQVQQQVVDLLGADFVTNGQLNRAKIRKVVFGNDKLHKSYSQIFNDGIKNVLLQHVNNSNGTVFVEIPLIDAFPFDWQQVWLVHRDLEYRIGSVVIRDKVSRQEVLDIISKQPICNCFTVQIDNNGTLAELHNQIDNLLKANNLC